MKKIIIIVAAVVMAFTSQAASFKWTGANIYDHTGTTKFDGTAAIYAYLTTATVADAVKVVDVNVIGGIIKQDASTTGYTYNWTGATGGATYNFYMVIQDGDYTFDSSVSTPAVIKQGTAAATSTTTVGFANMATATGSGNWAAVLEPTSGLLMLLGMAGLALRRRRV